MTTNGSKEYPSVVFFLRNCPEKLKARFKAYCAAHGYTMQDAIVKLIERAVEKDKPLR